MAEEIKGIKVIRLNSQNINLPDDPSFPFKAELSFSPPEFLEVAFVFMHGGSEELIVRGMTKEILEEFLSTNRLRNHPRLRKLIISGPEGTIEEFSR